jgi:SDR family mycofactocin-dependent oxidoreductase
MAGRLTGKVAFITGAARGQGRAHALRMAEEGADIIGIDACVPFDSVNYPMSEIEDLIATKEAVEKLDRRALFSQADVRELDQVREAVNKAVAELGRLDIVAASAGIWPGGGGMGDYRPFFDALAVDLVGPINTVSACAPLLADGASVIITGSTAALMQLKADNPAAGPGGAGYAYAKRTLVSLVEQLALQFGPRGIRVNAVHPSNVNTHLLHNENIYGLFRPDLENPSRSDAEEAFRGIHLMPIPYIEPVDVANLVVFLASDESRYITGQQFRIDAGSLLKSPGGWR